MSEKRKEKRRGRRGPSEEAGAQGLVLKKNKLNLSEFDYNGEKKHVGGEGRAEVGAGWVSSGVRLQR